MKIVTNICLTSVPSVISLGLKLILPDCALCWLFILYDRVFDAQVGQTFCFYSENSYPKYPNFRSSSSGIIFVTLLYLICWFVILWCIYILFSAILLWHWLWIWWEWSICRQFRGSEFFQQLFVSLCQYILTFHLTDMGM